MERFLKKKEVCYLTSLSPAELERRERDGRFPRRRRLSNHQRGRVVWVDTEVVEWMGTFLPQEPTDGSE